jgi:hypothetical protein
MRRGIVFWTSAIGLVLCVVGFGISFTHPLTITATLPGATWVGADVTNGHTLVRAARHTPKIYDLTKKLANFPHGPFQPTDSARFNMCFSTAGFFVDSHSEPVLGFTIYDVGFPVWTPLPLFMACLLWHYRNRLRRFLRRRRNACVTCGYSLTGNTSGVCPECGTNI